MSNKYGDAELKQAIIQTVNERKPQDVRQLINFVREIVPVSEEKLIDAIMRLQNQGTIKLNQSKSIPSNVAIYLKTGQALWYWATIATATLTAAIVFAVPENSLPWSYLRNVFGALFVLCLPGYSFVKALFPVEVPIKTSAENLDTIERIALSFGMSLSLVPLIGLPLSYTPGGIRLTPVVLSLFILTLVCATAGVVREHQAKMKT